MSSGWVGCELNTCLTLLLFILEQQCQAGVKCSQPTHHLTDILKGVILRVVDCTVIISTCSNILTMTSYIFVFRRKNAKRRMKYALLDHTDDDLHMMTRSKYGGGAEDGTGISQQYLVQITVLMII